MSLFDRIAEEKIQAAMRQGQFDQLAGKGRKLNLEDNPHEPESQRLSNHLLRNNGFLPIWLEIGQEIEQEINLLRTQIRTAGTEINWTNWRHQIDAINRRIFSYNLQVPLQAFQRPLLDLEYELNNAGVAAQPPSSKE